MPAGTQHAFVLVEVQEELRDPCRSCLEAAVGIQQNFTQRIVFVIEREFAGAARNVRWMNLRVRVIGLKRSASLGLNGW